MNQSDALRIGGRFLYRCAEGGHQFAAVGFTTICPWHGADCDSLYLMVDPESVAYLAGAIVPSSAI